MRRAGLLALVFTTALATVSCTSKARLPTIELKIGDNKIEAEVADEDSERMQGLMYREELPENGGMLFVYAAPEELKFWMKNTKIPLSIAFIDADTRIVRIADLEPHDLESTSSGQAALYALEMQRGWFDKHGITEGSTVEGLPGPSDR